SRRSISTAHRSSSSNRHTEPRKLTENRELRCVSRASRESHLAGDRAGLSPPLPRREEPSPPKRSSVQEGHHACEFPQARTRSKTQARRRQPPKRRADAQAADVAPA